MTAREAAPVRITAEVLLDVFDAPVTLHRCLVPIAGGVTAALMLSHAITVTQAASVGTDGWFVRSQEQWTEETGLSRWEQATARRTLRSAGLLEERRCGMPAKLWFRVRAEAIWAALHAQAAARAG